MADSSSWYFTFSQRAAYVRLYATISRFLQNRMLDCTRHPRSACDILNHVVPIRKNFEVHNIGLCTVVLCAISKLAHRTLPVNVLAKPVTQEYCRSVHAYQNGQQNNDGSRSSLMEFFLGLIGPVINL